MAGLLVGRGVGHSEACGEYLLRVVQEGKTPLTRCPRITEKGMSATKAILYGLN